MATFHSTARQAQPAAFNSHSPYDPFFACSDDDEHLVPRQDEHTPSHASYRSPSPSVATLHNQGENGLIPGPAHESDATLDPLPNNRYHSALQSHRYTDSSDTIASQSFLSPHPYPSENGYNASSELTATPEFTDEGFYLEDNFGVLDPSDIQCDYTSAALEMGPTSDPSTRVASPPMSTLRTENISPGTATLSSHLMSPVLTESHDAISRQGTSSPHIAAAAVSPGSSYFQPPPPVNGDQVHQSNIKSELGPAQQTPSATEASKGSSPEIADAVPHLLPAASPTIQIEHHTLDDMRAGSPRISSIEATKRCRAESGGSYYDGQRDKAEELGFVGIDDQYSVINNQGGSIDGVRKGLDPEARYQARDVELPSLEEQAASAQVASKNADVAEWLDRSSSGGETGADLAPPRPILSTRQRARSGGTLHLSSANLQILRETVSDAHIPGPGVLIDEDSGDNDSELDDDGIASIEDSPPPTTALPGGPVNEVSGEARPGEYQEVPLQPPLYRAKLWQDPLYDSSDPGIKMQPVSSNAAIVRFEQRAKEFETMSRVATWGTRRVSESDMHSLFHRLSISEATKEGNGSTERNRSRSILQQAAARFMPRRNTTQKGSVKRQDSNQMRSSPGPVRPSTLEHNRNDSSGSANLGVPGQGLGLKRVTSLGKRPKSPKINTGSAVAAMASQIAALGANGSVSGTTTTSPTSPWSLTKNVMKRNRSRSDLNGPSPPPMPNSSSEGLAELWTRQGGPPMPTLAAPKTEEAVSNIAHGQDHDEEDEDVEDHGVKMDLSIRPDPIVPTLEGFKANIRQLNPRLPPFMFDRIAQEQLRRFKKLMDFKIKHAQALAMARCASGEHCVALGGEPTYLPSKAGSVKTEVSHVRLANGDQNESDEDANALADGIVTAAQFPAGVPLPPAKRLPAKFECSLCYKVKTYNKPSDWSKHVHEDAQPFTCTFEMCAEPKSFKRKADWVRHENERHRQLEWWMCSINECQHKCYRKDNFVQHLVREHKLPEPKIRPAKAGKPSVRGPSSQKARNAKLSDENGDDSPDEIDHVWRLVEECRHETPKSPKDEPCKFCGNICNSWKKLTVHLAKHMEQISMPVLDVVRRKQVTAETIISPIEQHITSHQNGMVPMRGSVYQRNGLPLDGSGLARNSSSVSNRALNMSMIPTRPNIVANPRAQMPMMNHQRASPHTYPPPLQPQQNAARSAASQQQQQGHNGVVYQQTPEYGQSSSTTGSLSQPNGMHNMQRSFIAMPTSSSPEMIRSRGQQAPTSEPRSSPYIDYNGFQYAGQQQMPLVNSPIEESMYHFGVPQHGTAMTYPPQTQSHGMGSMGPGMLQPAQGDSLGTQYPPVGTMPNDDHQGTMQYGLTQQQQQQQQSPEQIQQMQMAMQMQMQLNGTLAYQ